VRLLLDTHVALWALGDPDRLSDEASSLIADPAHEVYVSAVTVWEVEIKRAIGKLTAPDDFATEVIERGFDGLAIDLAHASAAGRLPLLHPDPFDRMLVAQAMVEGLILVSDDRNVSAYEVVVLRAT